MNKNYDYVMQQNNTDCGIASLMTILMYYGIKPSREKIISKLSKKCGGYTAYDLIKTSKSYGLKSYGLKTNLKSIKKFPVIAHTIKDKNMFHFIVIYETNNRKKTLKIMDPSSGIKIISYDEFEKETTGIFLIFEGKKKKKIKDLRFKKEIIKIFQTNKKIIVKTLFLSIIFVLISLVFNYYLKTILTYQNNYIYLIYIFLIFLNLSLLKNVINYLKNRLILNLSTKIDSEITNNVSNHILNLPYEYFIKKTTGELVTILEDIENFKEVITKIFILSLVDLILIGIILIYICILNIYIGLSITLIIIIIILITKKYQYIFNDSYLKYKTSKINYNSFLINSLTSFETIKNLNITKNVSIKLLSNYQESLKKDKTYNKKYYNYAFITTLLTDMFYVLIIFISSYLVIKNGLNSLDVVLFSSFFYMVIGFLSNITESISLYKVYQTSTNRILDCLEVPCEMFPKTKFTSLRTIKFKDINYQKNEQTLLKNINIDIKKGDRIYLTGESGIGKSTLMKLLLRYFTPTGGTILIDNVNLKDLDLTFIRNHITYIGQNEELFLGTIKENLEIVTPDENKIKEISKLTLLDKVLKNNQIDYNYLIEESGYNLSGGERKKIILTRGLLKFKSVLILDEVFNEISVEEEKQILNNIFLKYPDKIIIMITHRKTSKNLFNKKYKLEGEGDLIEIK